MTLDVSPSPYVERTVVIEGELAVSLPTTEVCDLVEKLLPHADVECDELVNRITTVLMPHITKHLSARNWTPTIRYPCGCNPGLLCPEHSALRWDEYAARTGH
jgi:hypothetical protein